MNGLHRGGRSLRLALVILVATVTPLLALVPSAAAQASSGADGLIGSQGTDVALPDTESAVTVPGVGADKQMSFHLSKTRNLTNEAISVSWRGGVIGTPKGPLEDTNFVQIMQCWGDPVVAADGTAGPPPEQCVFGADPDGLRSSATNNGFEFIRAKMPSIDHWIPFKSVDGTVVTADTGPNPNNPSTSTWLNPFYSKSTSNEIGGLRNSFDGSGTAFFEIHTGLQSAGLGCGQKMKNGSYPKCWLVMVPRGPHDDVAGVDDRGQAATSPLDARGPWKNRVAVPLDFTPVASGCALSNAQESLSGADLSLPAMDRWLPTLCTQAGAPPYIYTRTPEDRARTLLVQRAAGGTGDGMIVTNTPIDPATLPPGRVAVYAPLDISAVVVGFSIQRHGLLDGLGESGNDAFEKIQSSYVQHLKLTPLLVAKLLTQSYSAYLQPGTYFLTDSAKARYAWSVDNPTTMFFDPDFQALNPEFAVLAPAGIESATTLEVSLGSSAAATAIWRWIKADPAAAKWLTGSPDDHGMRVNPYFSTNAAGNPNGAAFQIPPSGGFPKNDPLSWITPDAAQVGLPALSLNNEWPYQDSLQSTARVTRTGNRGAKINYDPNSPLGYATSGTQPLGSRAMLSITDAADAQRFGIQTAALQNANGDFVEPKADGLAKGVAAMVTDPSSGMLQPDYAVRAASAYPLTTVDYAASVPSVLTAKERSDYSRLLQYAAGPGQVTGEALGQLPRGYLALPATIRATTLAAALQVGSGLPALPTVATRPSTSPVATPTTSAPRSTSAPASTSSSLTSTAPTTASATGRTTSITEQPTRAAWTSAGPGGSDETPSATGGSGTSGIAGGPNDAPSTAAPAATSTTSTTPVPRSAAASAKPSAVPSNPRDTAPKTEALSRAATSGAADVRLASVTTGADPAAVPWVAILFAVGVAAALGVPLAGRVNRRRRTR